MNVVSLHIATKTYWTLISPSCMLRNFQYKPTRHSCHIITNFNFPSSKCFPYLNWTRFTPWRYQESLRWTSSKIRIWQTSIKQLRHHLLHSNKYLSITKPTKNEARVCWFGKWPPPKSSETTIFTLKLLKKHCFSPLLSADGLGYLENGPLKFRP